MNPQADPQPNNAPNPASPPPSGDAIPTDHHSIGRRIHEALSRNRLAEAVRQLQLIHRARVTEKPQ